MFEATTFEAQSTMDVPDKLKFDIPTLQAYMEKRVAGFRGQLSVKKFGLGQSNPTFLLTTDSNQAFVMRRQPMGTLIPGAHAVDREARVLSALSKTKFPVPDVYSLCTDTSVLGSMFYIMSFKKGRIFDNALVTATAGKREVILFNTAKILASLHTQDIQKLGLADFAKNSGFYDRQIKTMTKVTHSQTERAKGKIDPIPRLDELIAWFKANNPPDKCTLIHGDYKPDNIVFAPGSDDVIAVLDWELSTLGHPLSDLANLCLSYYIPSKSFYPSFYKEANKLLEGVPTQEALHKVYCASSGTSYPIPSWHFYIVFAMFRLAVILQGVAMRSALGVASHTSALSPDAAKMVLQMFTQMMFDTIKKAESASKL